MTIARFGLAAAFTLAAAAASAQVPADLKAKIAAAGPIVDPSSAAALYRPLQPSAPYAGVTVARNLSYGPDARNLLDVFTPASGGGARPVLLFVPGGAGDKIVAGPGGEAFYDNVMLWAAKNGMTGVDMQRRGTNYVDAAHDIASAIQWIQANIAKYGGDPDRIFVWGHSAGATSTANYLAHPEWHGPRGVGVKGAVLMAGAYNLAPYQPKTGTIPVRTASGAPLSARTLVEGSPQERLAWSQAAGLKATNVPLFVSAGELEPPLLAEMAQELDRELTAAARPHAFVVYKDHSHMSEVFAVGTSDVSTSAPVLAWMRAIR